MVWWCELLLCSVLSVIVLVLCIEWVWISLCFCLMIRRPPRSTQSRSSAASDVYKRQAEHLLDGDRVVALDMAENCWLNIIAAVQSARAPLSLIHISEPTRLLSISYAVFCLKKKKNTIHRITSHQSHHYPYTTIPTTACPTL